MAIQPEPALAPELAALVGLMGRWEGEGAGEYPTIPPFRYRETVTLSHVGKPFLAYNQRTVNLATGLPAHAEAGYWRPVGDRGLEVVMAHPTGIVEAAEGTVTPTSSGLRIELVSSVIRTPAAKEVSVVERRFELNHDVLRYDVSMAAVGQPLQHHLAAELFRTD
jgi:hypothetical protein